MSQQSAAARARSGSNPSRDLLRTAATVVGAVFLLVGVLGFIPGITSNYSDLTFAGHNSQAKLLGVFQVSVLHNVVHLLFGVAGLAMSRRRDTARTYLIGGGVIYLVLWLYGLVVGQESSANFVPVNTADDWLHFVLGVGMIGLGVALARRPAGAATAR
jgi:arginine exporter protein ArgO